MICPRCKTDNLIIRQAEDSNFKEVFCNHCNYKGWLKHFNKRNLEAKPCPVCGELTTLPAPSSHCIPF